MGRRCFIGVDTGGTFTDAAVIEAGANRVIASAKALTTKGDLALGVETAIAQAVRGLPGDVGPADIAMVGVSTTLATNAVVEGHGSPVGVLLIGFDARMAERAGISRTFPGMPLGLVRGGHDHNGDAREPLDLFAVEQFAAGAKVDAFAIAGSFAVRNPAHEIEAREVVHRLTGKPVTISTELSTDLDAPRRALTAALNARLISRITMLIEAVERAKRRLGIVCPLMVVKGDGTLALASSVVKRPIETVLSGPAASMVGAAWLSGRSDFIMSDMGGTTTDLGIVEGGRPRIALEGAEVGNWRTMVKAIDLRTSGLGGDSEVQTNVDGRISIGPQRIVPISLIGSKFPEVRAMLEADLADHEGGSMHGRYVIRPFGASEEVPADGLSAREREILRVVSDRPLAIRRIAGSASGQRALTNLKKRGLVQICGFTPSDAAHVLDLQNNWSASCARIAAELTVRHADMRAASDSRVREFCQAVWSETVRRAARAILDLALGPIAGGEELLDAVCRGSEQLGLAHVKISPAVPVIAVGGPAKVYFGEVGRRLGCEIFHPAHFDVANAVGAATGVVSARIIVTVEGDGGGVFRVHGPAGTTMVSDGSQALGISAELAREAAGNAVRNQGAEHFEIDVTTRKVLLPDAVDDNGLLSAEVTAEAVGRPFF